MANGEIMGSVDLEVAYDQDRKAWVVRPFRPYPVPKWIRRRSKVFSVADTRSDALATGRALGRVFADYINQDRTCELYVRRLDGTWGPRESYGHDPMASRD